MASTQVTKITNGELDGALRSAAIETAARIIAEEVAELGCDTIVAAHDIVDANEIVDDAMHRVRLPFPTDDLECANEVMRQAEVLLGQRDVGVEEMGIITGLADATHDSGVMTHLSYRNPDVWRYRSARWQRGYEQGWAEGRGTY